MTSKIETDYADSSHHDKTEATPGTLVVPSAAQIKNDLAILAPASLRLDAQDEKDLSNQADQYVEQLLSFDPQQFAEQQARKDAVEQMGAEVQRRATKQSALLQQPIKTLSKRGADGGDVANALIDLKMKVEDLDPGKIDLEAGWLTRTIGLIPGVGTPIKRYFSKYESAQTVIGAIIRSLENGRDQLKRDNVTLTEDQKQMREMTRKLEQAVKLGSLIDQKLQYKLEREITPGDPKHAFVSEELLFPLRQRIIDLQQQLAVNQQGVLASEIIIRNNKELARGVDRALNVTITALEVGATVAMALANQKVVLDKIDAVNKTTSDLISKTAERLKTQGVQIHKQASSAQLDMQSLKKAFGDIQAAMDDLSTFRLKALPQMASTILELDQVSAQAEKAIQKMEEGNRARPSIKIDVV
jgi:uncharacterized protein YaaN involved in tellurite resistance